MSSMHMVLKVSCSVESTLAWKAPEVHTNPAAPIFFLRHDESWW